jgi:3'-phosphoadenosine 5'-phosphosulfate sulfotransferase (PAPS reductase)/FAD synthetase
MRDKILLRQLQALPLDAKELMSQQRIREWYNYWNGKVVISFSGGKDSTVLAHLVHDLYPDIPLVFANTGLEFPEIQAFARKMGAEFVRPKMSFSEVISTYGYPIISKENAEAIHYARKIRNTPEQHTTNRKRSELTDSRPKVEHEITEEKVDRRRKYDQWRDWRRESIQGTGAFAKENKSIFNKAKWLPLCNDTQFMISHMCCSIMKKGPMGIYQRTHKVFPYIGTLADESKLREQAWIRHGCNSFEGTHRTSQPMSFWMEQDVLRYIFTKGLEICSVYGEIIAEDKDGMQYDPNSLVDLPLKCQGCQRTGCIFCGFGAHLEKKGETRFQMLARTHPRQYEYCMGGGQWVDNPKYDPSSPKMDGEWKNWNPKKIWVPSKEGLGMKKVFDDCNQIYGKDFIRYE